MEVLPDLACFRSRLMRNICGACGIVDELLSGEMHSMERVFRRPRSGFSGRSVKCRFESRSRSVAFRESKVSACSSG